MSSRSREIQALLGVKRVPQFEVPNLSTKSGFAFPARIIEEYPISAIRVGMPQPIPLGAYTLFGAKDTLTGRSNTRLEWIVCPHCHEKYIRTNMRMDESASLYVCDNCWRERGVKCDCCGNPTTHPEIATKGGNRQLICNGCARNSYVVCDVCGISSYQTNTINGQDMCKECESKYRSNHTYCNSCGSWHDTLATVNAPGATNRVCFKCYIKLSSSKKPIKEILPYSKTQASAFFATIGGEILYYGVEYETQNGRCPEDQDRHDRTFAEQLWFFKECFRKRDGSVSLGHEIVTLPLTLEYHKKFFNWKGLCELHRAHDFKAHDDPKSGIHIHCSKAAFGGKATELQKKKIGALLFLLQRKDWRDNWKKFSRRNNKAVQKAIVEGRFGSSSDPWGYCQWYSSFDYDNCTIIEGYKEALIENRSYRNRVLNFYTDDSHDLVASKTVEWRMNKSTDEYLTIWAMLEMYDVLIKIATGKHTEAGLRALTWKGLCRKIPNGYSALVNYLKAKRLWVA